MEYYPMNKLSDIKLEDFETSSSPNKKTKQETVTEGAVPPTDENIENGTKQLQLSEVKKEEGPKKTGKDFFSRKWSRLGIYANDRCITRNKVCRYNTGR